MRGCEVSDLVENTWIEDAGIEVAGDDPCLEGVGKLVLTGVGGDGDGDEESEEHRDDDEAEDVVRDDREKDESSLGEALRVLDEATGSSRELLKYSRSSRPNQCAVEEC